MRGLVRAALDGHAECSDKAQHGAQGSPPDHRPSLPPCLGYLQAVVAPHHDPRLHDAGPDLAVSRIEDAKLGVIGSCRSPPFGCGRAAFGGGPFGAARDPSHEYGPMLGTDYRA